MTTAPSTTAPSTPADSTPADSTPALSTPGEHTVSGVDAGPAARYSGALAGGIEARWQRFWAENETYRTPEVPAVDAQDPGAAGRKRFVMDMFPYPSGAGLHVGHPLGYIATDVYARYLRMAGDDVLYTMGFDAFGLPAEQFAVRTGAHPRTTTEANITEFLRQLRRIGLSHDESRRISTIDPGFFRWTQWQFLQIYQSWFDVTADGGRGRARPITELIAAFADGSRSVPAGVDGVPAGAFWDALTVAQRAAVLDSFRLAYADTAPVNWCPGLGTVLSNEEVTTDGRSERGNFPVFTRDLRQWKMRITAYADRLLADLDRVDWPESVRSMQRNWIGRSTGARVRFVVDGAGSLEVFTTRPDTLFGATFMVVNPAHPVLASVPAVWPADTDPRWTGGAPDPRSAVESYRAELPTRGARDEGADREKTGVFTGLWAVNPVDGRPLPVFAADYVLAGYGTGAIMAVPGQDERDFDFATAYGLPVIRTVAPPADFTGGAWTGPGAAINSANSEISLNGLDIATAKDQMIAWLSARGAGEAVVQYRLRDWLFSRQRYWGEPFPIVYDAAGLAHPIPDDLLPVALPEVADYSPVTFDPDDAESNPQPPLGRATEWVTVTLDLGEGTGPQEYRRETSTMPNWAGSCWYELRYLSPDDSKRFVDAEAERFWMGPGRGAGAGVAGDPGGVDLYVGGVEHAVLHLLYSRFWHKVLFDLGLVSSEEPFRRLVNQGYIQAYAYTDARGFYVEAEEVVEDSPGVFTHHGEPVTREYGKIGKSLRNVVTPDQVCDRYGADTFRLFEMSMGPLPDSRPWATKDVIGSHRFLQRLWRLMVSEDSGALAVTHAEVTEATLRVLHATIAGVGADYAELHHNTAAAKLIELVNHLTKTYAGPIPRAVAEPLVLMVAPLCPHVAEELWSLLGNPPSVTRARFPVADERWLVEDTVEYPVQVAGKVRARITVAADADPATVEAAALADPRIVELLAGTAPRRVVVVAGRLVNIVP
jgi:leucyl-tRNA synthetase